MESISPAVDVNLKDEVKRFIVSELRLSDVSPDDIRDAESLAEGSLGLDSIDFLELAVALEKHYGIKITQAEEAAKVLATVDSLASHIAQHRTRSPVTDAG